jgi:sugar/nucleoside kinase (ribokinase family)
MKTPDLIRTATMQALFIGQTYIDVTFLTDRLPTGDEKHVASNYAVSFGGNAVTAAFCCAKLSITPELMTSIADDWLGRMFLDMAEKYAITIHSRPVNASSLSFIMPNGGKRAIVRCRDDDYLASVSAPRSCWLPRPPRRRPPGERKMKAPMLDRLPINGNEAIQ